MIDKNICIKNIYYMLAYAFTNLKFDDIKKVSAEEFTNIHNLLAAILAEGIGKLLKQGLYREYINCSENLSTVRGKIILPETVKNITAGRRKIFCDFDELSENNLFNQILKTTARLFLRNENVADKYKNLLRRELLFFSAVEEVQPQFIYWQNLRWKKNNQTYQLLINICRLVLEGMILTTSSGELKLKNFLDDQKFYQLYEKFLLSYYQKHFPQFKPRITQFDWATDGEKNFLPKMKTDITLSAGDKVLIIDAKYYSKTLIKNYGKQTIHSANLYQIFAYVKNFSFKTSKQVAGMLLYARTEEQIQPNNIYKICGDTISVKTLDLNQDFAEIQSQLANIIAENF